MTRKTIIIAMAMTFAMLAAAMAVVGTGSSESDAAWSGGDGIVKAVSETGIVNGNNVTYDSGTTLGFTASGNAEGRTPNNWWAGIIVEAPEGASQYATFQNKMPWDKDWNQAKSYFNNTDHNHYAPVQQRYIEDYGTGDPKKLVYEYRYDWDADGVYDQTVTMTVLDGIMLKDDGDHYYEWRYNGTVHWKECGCGEKDPAHPETEHTLGEWEVVSEPTYTSNGLEQRSCDECRYRESKTIGMLTPPFVSITDEDEEEGVTYAQSASGDDDTVTIVACAAAAVVAAMMAAFLIIDRKP